MMSHLSNVEHEIDTTIEGTDLVINRIRFVKALILSDKEEFTDEELDNLWRETIIDNSY